MTTRDRKADGAKLHKLSAKAVEKAKAGVHPEHGAAWGKDFKLTDGGGLYLLVRVNGAKLWQYGYRHAGKEQTLSIGEFPHVTLQAARRRHSEARGVVADGKNPMVEKRAEQQRAFNETFSALFTEWVETQKPDWAPSNLKKITQLADANLLPYLRDRPVKDVKPPELLAVLRRIEKRGALDLARRCGSILKDVFALAMGSGRSETNPAFGLNGLLKNPQTSHRAAVTDPEGMGNLLRHIEAYSGGAVVGAALKLSALTFLRPGELRLAEWQHIDFDKGEWMIPVANRKLKTTEKRKTETKPHLVPLSAQAVAVLRELHLLTSRSKFVFPGERSPRTRPMSDGAVLVALRTMGFGKDEMSAHGFRASARTLLAELGWRTDAIERQLSHASKEVHGGAYDRAAFVEERRKMMQAWADYLDVLARGESSNVVPLRRA